LRSPIPQLVEEKKLDFEKIGRADLACRTAQRLAYHWQTTSPGWRLSFAPAGDYETVLVTLHRTEPDVPSGTESIPVEDLDWRLADADIFRQITMVGSRLLGSWIKQHERAKAHTPLQTRGRT
jgi:hypothetical protein